MTIGYPHTEKIQALEIIPADWRVIVCVPMLPRFPVLLYYEHYLYE